MTKFAIIMLMLALIALYPVQALDDTPDTFGGSPFSIMDFDLVNDDFSKLSDVLLGLATQSSTFQVQDLRVLAEQTLPSKPPPEWILVNFFAEDWKTMMAIRSDNLDLCAFTNSAGDWYVFEDSAMTIPGSTSLEFRGGYRYLNGIRSNLTLVPLSKQAALQALQILSEYHEVTGDRDQLKRALTTFVLIMCEAQRFTEIHDCVLNGWHNECHIRRSGILLLSWARLSCGVLERWTPNAQLLRRPLQYYATVQGYRDMLNNLQIKRIADAPRLLKVLIRGTACQDNIKGKIKIIRTDP